MTKERSPAMRKTVTSRKEILKNCQNIVANKDLTALDIRTVADACHVSVGSIYNHFSSKDDLVYEVLNQAWGKIFDLEDSKETKDKSLDHYLQWLFSSLAKKKEEHPNFFNYYSLGTAFKNPEKGAQLFENHLKPLKEGLKEVWKNDSSIPSSLEKEEQKIDFIFTSLLSVLLSNSMEEKDFIQMVKSYLNIESK